MDTSRSPSGAPPPQQGPAPGQASPAQPGNWHRYHHPIGIFLVLYGLSGLLGVLIGWSDHRKEIASYLTKTAGLSTGLATPTLVGLHVVEGLLILITLAGLLRRRDIWFLPVAFGWMAGFAVFCVLDVWAVAMGRLAEHAVYLVGFTLVLLMSYALGIKARVGRAAPSGQQRSGLRPQNLSRTQEIALSALNRWQRVSPPGPVQSPAGGQPQSAPEGPPPEPHVPAQDPAAPPAPVPAPVPVRTSAPAADPAPDPAPATDPPPAPAPASESPPAPAPSAEQPPPPPPAVADPAPAPAPAPQKQQHSPLPPPRKFPVTPPP